MIYIKLNIKFAFIYLKNYYLGKKLLKYKNLINHNMIKRNVEEKIYIIFKENFHSLILIKILKKQN